MYPQSGQAYTHPAFKDVYFVILKKFFVPIKRVWKLKVTWMHRRGWVIGNDKLVVSEEKMKEFVKRDETFQDHG